MTRRAGYALLVALLALSGTTAPMSSRAAAQLRLNTGIEWLAASERHVDAKVRRLRAVRRTAHTIQAPLLRPQTSAPSVHIPLISLQLPPPAALE